MTNAEIIKKAEADFNKSSLNKVPAIRKLALYVWKKAYIAALTKKTKKREVTFFSEDQAEEFANGVNGEITHNFQTWKVHY